MRTLFIFAPIVVCFAQSVAASAQSIDWLARFDAVGAGDDETRAAVVTSTGIMAVLTDRRYNSVLFTVDASGNPVAQTSLGQSDVVFTGTLTAAGNSIFAGALRRNNVDFHQSIVVLLQLDAAAARWSEHVYESSWDWRSIEALAADAIGNVLVTGSAIDDQGQLRLVLVSFDSSGNVRWATQLDGEELPWDAKRYARTGCDGTGNAYIAATVQGPNGSRDGDLMILKYDPAGQRLWTSRFNLDPNETDSFYKPGTVLADDAGVFACAFGGFDGVSSGIISLRLDAAGNPVWHDVYDRGEYYPQARQNPLDGGYYVTTTVYVGEPPTPPHRDFLLLRYGPDGQRLFDRQYENDLASVSGIVVDPDGQAVLAGNSTLQGTDRSVRALRVSPDGQVIWSRQYSWPGTDPWISCRALLADAQGRATFVATIDDPHTAYDAALLTLNPDGEIADTLQLNSDTPSQDAFCYGSVADSHGNVYVALDSRQYPDVGRWVVVKYDPAGLEEWRHRVTEWGSRPALMAIDPLDNITVVGSVADDGSADTGDILAIRMHSDGSEVWRSVYDGPTGQRDYPVGLAISDYGDVYISGWTVIGDQTLNLLLKFDGGGHFEWDQLAAGAGRLMKVAADGDLLFVNWGGLTCFSPDGLWQWNSPLPASNGCNLNLRDMTLDRFGNVLLTGSGCVASPDSALTVIKFSPTGELRWVALPEESRGATGQRVVLDRQNNVFFAGNQYDSGGGNPPAQYLVTGRLSPQGATGWIARHFLGRSDFGGMVDLARGEQCIYVTGQSEDFFALRYDLDGRLAWKADYYEPSATDARLFRLTLDSEERPVITGSIRGADVNSDIVSVCYGAAPPPCGGAPECRAADVNGDCQVDLADLFIVLTNFGVTQRGAIAPADGDLTFDGKTDINDLARLLSGFELDCQ